MLALALLLCLLPQTAPELPTRALVLRSRVTLGSPPPAAHAIRDVWSFGFDERSRLRFVRTEANGTATLVMLESDGSVARETAVPAFPGDEGVSLFPLTRERWIAALPSYVEEWAPLWLVSESEGSAREVPGLSVRDVERVLPLDDDAFVLLGSWRTAAAKESGLLACTFDGSVRWSQTQLSWPQDACVTTDGRVVVLEHYPAKRLKVISSSGEPLATLVLAEVLGHAPNYPSGVEADRDGGVLVYDFQGTPPLCRLDSAGVLREGFDIRRADGTSLGEYRSAARVAPDGRTWTTDRHEFLRVGADGVVDLELGTAENVDVLEAPGFCRIESLFGRVLIHDQRSRAVHVFDLEGRRVMLCRPKPEERDELRFPMALAVAPDGSVYVARSMYEERVLRFTSEGTSCGFEGMDCANVAFRLDGGHAGESDGAVQLVAAAAPERLEESADEERFRSIVDVAFAADGSLAVLDEPATINGVTRQPGSTCVALFGPHGEPKDVVSVPAGIVPREVAYQSGRVLLSDWSRAWLLNPDSRRVEEVLIHEAARSFGLSSDGKELLAIAEDGRSLLRFVLD